MVRRQRFGAGAYFILFHIPIYSLFSMSQLKLQVEFPNRDPKDTLDFQFSNTWNSQMSRSSQIQNTTVPQLCLLLCLIFFIIPYLTAFSFSYRQNMSKLLETLKFAESPGVLHCLGFLVRSSNCCPADCSVDSVVGTWGSNIGNPHEKP